MREDIETGLSHNVKLNLQYVTQMRAHTESRANMYSQLYTCVVHICASI